MLSAALRLRSASNPHEGHKCSRIHSSFSVSTPQAKHSPVVPRGSTATKWVPLRSYLFEQSQKRIPTPLRYDSGCSTEVPSSPLRRGLRPLRDRIPERSSSRACAGSPGASASGRRGVVRRYAVILCCIPSFTRFLRSIVEEGAVAPAIFNNSIACSTTLISTNRMS